MKRLRRFLRCFGEEIDRRDKYIAAQLPPERKVEIPIHPVVAAAGSPKPYDSDFLYVILPYFNFCKYQSRTRLFLEFVKRNAIQPKVRMVVVEARLAGEEYQLPAEMDGVYKYIGVQTASECWLKESLINIGISNLPDGWLYAAWIDADITFLNTSWVEDTMRELATRDVVQLFQTLVYLGPNEEALKTERSLGYMHLDSGIPYTKNDRYGHFMPGMAWALTHRAYKAMGGLLDWAILGSADRHMSYALMGRVDDSCPGNISEGYRLGLREFQARCRRGNLRLGYIKGTILHHWHGRLEDRRYKERWDILVRNKYDPEFDTYYNSSGLIQLTDRGKRMAPALHDYFVGRREDNTTTGAPKAI